MSLFKFGTIGAYEISKNNPRAVATADTKNGYVFKIVDNYTSGGSKSKVVITVAGTTPADGVITFEIGGQTVYTPITGLTHDTAEKVAAEIKDSLDAVLLGLNYTIAINSAAITVTAPANGASIEPVTLENINMGETACTLANVYTAGTAATTYLEAAAPSDDDAGAKADELWVALNIIDTPELLNQSDFVVKAGSYVNAFNLNSLIGMPVEMSSDLCTTAYASVTVGDHLVPVPAGANAMKWKKAADTGYGCTLKVIEKTTFGGTGYYCKISSN